MDDPLFDPWGFETELPSPGGTRWRAPSNLIPTPPSADRFEPRAASAESHRTAPLPRARLAGTPGFLRSMSVPRIAEVAQRLHLARHEATVEDLLDGTPPLVRLTVRPWRGPWTERLLPPVGVFELEVPSGSDDQVIVRIWLDADAEEPAEETRIQSVRLGAAWLDTRVLDFVARLLARG